MLLLFITLCSYCLIVSVLVHLWSFIASRMFSYFMFNFRCCDGKGCERSYHLSCLKPPLEDVPLGAWHCGQCTRKKIESGVHSLSGVESIWDSREVEVSDDSGECYMVPPRNLITDTALNYGPGNNELFSIFFFSNICFFLS